jgi:hypothetical protein
MARPLEPEGPRPRRGPGDRLVGRGLLQPQISTTRRFPRVCAAARRDPDGGSGAVRARGGVARQRATRGCPFRHVLGHVRPLEVGPGPFLHRPLFWSRHGSFASPAARGRAPLRRAERPPERRAAAGHLIADVVDQPGDEDRSVVGQDLARRALDARSVDDPSAAARRSGRGERRDLGPTRSPASTRRGAGTAPRPRRDPRGGDEGGGRGDESDGRRLHRHAEPAAERGASACGPRRENPGGCRGSDDAGRPTPARGRGHRDGRAPAAHRRRRHQRRARHPPHRGEAALGQHAGSHAGGRKGPGRPEACAHRRARRLHHLPPRDLHRKIAREPRLGDGARLLARHRRAVCVPLRVAHGRHQRHRHSAVTRDGGARPSLPGGGDQHDGARGARARPRGGGGRRHHRRREHRAPPPTGHARGA